MTVALGEIIGKKSRCCLILQVLAALAESAKKVNSVENSLIWQQTILKLLKSKLILTTDSSCLLCARYHCSVLCALSNLTFKHNEADTVFSPILQMRPNEIKSLATYASDKYGTSFELGDLGPKSIPNSRCLDLLRLVCVL